MLNRLADEHAIERISMQTGKLMEMEDSGLMKRKFDDAVTCSLLNEEPIKRIKKRQFAQGMLHRQFPCRYHTQKYFVGRVGEYLRRCRRQLFRS